MGLLESHLGYPEWREVLLRGLGTGEADRARVLKLRGGISERLKMGLCSVSWEVWQVEGVCFFLCFSSILSFTLCHFSTSFFILIEATTITARCLNLPFFLVGSSGIVVS